MRGLLNGSSDGDNSGRCRNDICDRPRTDWGGGGVEKKKKRNYTAAVREQSGERNTSVYMFFNFFFLFSFRFSAPRQQRCLRTRARTSRCVYVPICTCAVHLRSGDDDGGGGDKLSGGSH